MRTYLDRHLDQRRYAKARRERLKVAKLCINGEKHGPATDGVLCAKCRERHRK